MGAKIFNFCIYILAKWGFLTPYFTPNFCIYGQKLFDKKCLTIFQSPKFWGPCSSHVNSLLAKVSKYTYLFITNNSTNKKYNLIKLTQQPAENIYTGSG